MKYFKNFPKVILFSCLIVTKLYEQIISFTHFESPDIMRQIAEMWNLNKPGRLTQPEEYFTFQLCYLVKIQIAVKIFTPATTFVHSGY
jgi:hypothetical protein